jgi:hypothetical protein
LYFRIFSACFLITFLSPEIATSLNIHVLFSLSRIIMSGLLLEMVLSVIVVIIIKLQTFLLRTTVILHFSVLKPFIIWFLCKFVRNCRYIIWRWRQVKNSAANVWRVKQTPGVPVMSLRHEEAKIHSVMQMSVVITSWRHPSLWIRTWMIYPSVGSVLHVSATHVSCTPKGRIFCTHFTDCARLVIEVRCHCCISLI